MVSEYNKRKQWANEGVHWCTKCQEKLPVGMFGLSKNTMFGYNSWCKPCHSNFRTGHKKTQDRSRLRARSLMGHYIKLLGGQCAKCRYDKSQIPLEFHHINRAEKEHTLSPLISHGGSHEEIYYEINKCILLCANCHREFESSVWTCEFIKADIGYIIKEGSIIEFPENYWISETYAEKVLISQATLF